MIDVPECFHRLHFIRNEKRYLRSWNVRMILQLKSPDPKRRSTTLQENHEKLLFEIGTTEHPFFLCIVIYKESLPGPEVRSRNSHWNLEPDERSMRGTPRCYAVIAVIRRRRSIGFPREALLLVYRSFLIPLLTYCVSLWGGRYGRLFASYSK